MNFKELQNKIYKLNDNFNHDIIKLNCMNHGCFEVYTRECYRKKYKRVYEHIENYMEHLELDDCYILPFENNCGYDIIKKKYVNDVINTINNATSYSYIIEYYNTHSNPIIQEIYYDDSKKSLVIKTQFESQKEILYNILKKQIAINNEIKDLNHYQFSISIKDIDEYMEKKQWCKEEKIISEFNKIFNE